MDRRLSRVPPTLLLARRVRCTPAGPSKDPGHRYDRPQRCGRCPGSQSPRGSASSSALPASSPRLFVPSNCPPISPGRSPGLSLEWTGREAVLLPEGRGRPLIAGRSRVLRRPGSDRGPADVSKASRRASRAPRSRASGRPAPSGTPRFVRKCGAASRSWTRRAHGRRASRLPSLWPSDSRRSASSSRPRPTNGCANIRSYGRAGGQWCPSGPPAGQAASIPYRIQYRTPMRGRSDESQHGPSDEEGGSDGVPDRGRLLRSMQLSGELPLHLPGAGHWDRCTVFLAWRITSGEKDGIDVGGLSAALAVDSPKVMTEGVSAPLSFRNGTDCREDHIVPALYGWLGQVPPARRAYMPRGGRSPAPSRSPGVISPREPGAGKGKRRPLDDARDLGGR